MAKKIIVSSQSDVTQVSKVLEASLILNWKKLEVNIKNFVRDITDEQRKLAWVWYKQLASEIGDPDDVTSTSVEIHKMLKKRFLMAVYVRDDINGYQEVARNLNIMKQAGVETWSYFRQRAIEEMSIMNLNKEQMSEYLTNIKMFAWEEYQIALNTPETDELLKWYNDETDKK